FAPRASYLFTYTTLFRSPLAKHATVTNDHGRVVDNRPRQQIGKLRIGSNGLCKLLDMFAAHVRDQCLQLWQYVQGVPQASQVTGDRKSTRLNSSHVKISY